MYWAEQHGVYFVEGDIEGGRILSPISTELNEFFSQNHLRSLADLKERMGAQVREAGGNAVLNFKYGQRSSFFKSIFGMDNVLWFATGVIAQIDPAVLPARG